MGKRNENQGFICINCGIEIKPLSNGSVRNHCPACLHSIHLDIQPGDRMNDCKGMMKPIGIKIGKKGMQIIHECMVCGQIKVNKVAEFDDQPDDMDLVIKLMVVYH